MRVISLNLNGIRAATRHGLASFIQASDADILCFQELKADLSVLPHNPWGYHSCWHAAEKKGYSGVGILSTRQPDAVHLGLGKKVYDCEGRVLRADFDDLSVISVYVPSGTSSEARLAYKLRFQKAFKSYVKQLMQERQHLIICGDFNIAHHKIDLTNWQSNQKNSGFLPTERAWLDRFLKLGLHDVTRHYIGADKALYSWWSQRSQARDRNVGWRLDYQFTTTTLAEQLHFADIPKNPRLSDHAPVIADYDIAWP